jgi:hypothetical protein
VENWQLTWVILASVFVGALIPLLVMITIAFYRAGREIAEIGAQMKRTLTRVETISDRVEILSRGFKGGEKDIADLLTSVGHVARGLEQNIKFINISSTIMASVATAVSAFVKTRFPAQEIGMPLTPPVTKAPENGASPSPAAVTPEATINTQLQRADSIAGL